MIPILGARTEKQMRENLGCLDFELTTGQWQALDQLNPLSPRFPHDFLASEHVKNLIFGGTFRQIDNHHA